MKKNHTHITHRLLAYFMLVLMLFPVSANLIHLADHDAHYSCEDTTTHFHETPFDCELCDLQVANTLQFTPVSFTPSPEINFKKPFFAGVTFHNTNTTFHYTLRGPPTTV